MTSLNPGQMVVKIVHDELVELLGSDTAKLNFKLMGVTTIMMVGLQGTGKTTASAKIANVIKNKQSKKPLLVACDIIRPAAIEQLKSLGKSIDVEVFSLGVNVSALETAKKAMIYAQQNGYDTILFDTAGRLHIDEMLMKELKDIKEEIHPDEILLTVDAMTGQDIVGVAQNFHDLLSITGLVLTKLDGDSRGGGILSVKAITNVPVKFVGLGEKIDDLDVFHPYRMADRILGMGDIMTLVEKAQEKMDMDVNEKAAKRMMEGTFTLNDMLEQFHQLKKMGSISGLLKMIPGISQMSQQLDDEKTDKQMKKSEAIILSMTPEERENPSILRASRKNRIAKGSGTQVADVNRLITQFEKTKQMMKQMSSMSQSSSFPGMPSMKGFGKKKGFSKKMSKKKR